MAPLTMERLHWTDSLGINQRIASIISNLLVAGMMACLAYTLMLVRQAFVPAWGGGYLVWLGFLLSLEAIYLHTLEKNFSFPDFEWFLFHGAEWIALLILVKFSIFLANGFDQLWAEIPAWRANFWEGFFTGEYQFALVTLWIIWLLSQQFTAAIHDLNNDEAVLRVEVATGVFQERASSKRQLANLAIGAGALMTILTGLLRTDWDLPWGQIVGMRAGVYNVLLYFVLALILLSLSQLSMLRTRWYINEISMNPDVAFRWALYAGVFLVGVVLLAVILPTGYTIDFLTALNILMGLLMMGLNILVWLISLPILLLASLIGSLLGRSVEGPSAPALRLPALEVAHTSGESFPLIELIKSLLFWCVLLVLVIASLLYFIRTRRALWIRLQQQPILAWIIRSLGWLFSRARSLNARVSEAVRAGVQRLFSGVSSARATPGWRYVSLRRLSPRQRILFFYLALVRRGSQGGVPRSLSQTPAEYAQHLVGALENSAVGSDDVPGVGDDVQIITEQFYEARYSLHAITTEQSHRVHLVWGRLKRALRRVGVLRTPETKA